MRFTFASSLKVSVIALTLAVAPLRAQTFGSNSPTNGAGPFGLDAFYDVVLGSFAQTFVTPAGAPVLQSFTFYLADNFQGADLRVQANVYAFNTNRLVGPALYTSTVRSGSSQIDGSYDPIDFTGVNLTLTSGTTYAFVLRTAATSPDGSTNLFGTTIDESFGLGSLYTSVFSADADLLAPGAFVASSADSYGADAAIRATFVTPEPESLALVGFGLAGVIVLSRRRARSDG